jgi:hypothetical protein
MRRIPSQLREEYQGGWVGKRNYHSEGLFNIVYLKGAATRSVH